LDGSPSKLYGKKILKQINNNNKISYDTKEDSLLIEGSWPRIATLDPSGPPEETVQTCSTSRVYNIHYLASAERNKLDLGMNAVSLNNSNRGQKNIIHQYLQRRDPD
jgi:hypothetical protein